jgi:uncharacterized protein
MKAQTNLGKYYYDIEKDYIKAVEWYTKAAEQGNADAQNNLGNRYYNGEGVEKNYEKAVEWFTKAAEAGNTKALRNLRNYYHKQAAEDTKATKNEKICKQNHLRNQLKHY